MRTRVVNETRGVALAERAEVARTLLARLRGLLGRDGLPAGEGLVIEPCSSVHGIGMRFAIDVVFLDRNDCVRHAMHLRRGGLSPIVLGARRVVELPAGTISLTGTVRGDVVRIEPRTP